MKKPKVGDEVRFTETSAYGEENIRAGVVQDLLSKQFTVYSWGQEWPHFVFYTDDWEEI